MEVLDPGHLYALNILDGEGVEVLRFVKREGSDYPGNADAYAGTNLQEVLRACIDRVKYLNAQISDPSNALVIEHLREAIRLLEERAARRHGRAFVTGEGQIECEPTCARCGHVGCTEAAS